MIDCDKVGFLRYIVKEVQLEKTPMIYTPKFWVDLILIFSLMDVNNI